MNEILKCVEERWDAHSGSYDARHHGHNTEEDISMWKNVLEVHIGADRSVKVLDVGTGTGFLAMLIAELEYQCMGLDISKGMLDIAQNHAREKGLAIRFVQSTVENIPFPDNSVDMITNRSLMWTLLTPDSIVREWLRALKPGGMLLCFCTIGKGGDMQCNHYSQEIENMLPLKNASEEKLTAVLSTAGCTDVQAVRLAGLRNNHGDKTWYVIKGRKKQS